MGSILENFLLLIITGVLLLYFFSSMNVYKALYRKVNEEKNMMQDDGEKLKTLIAKYEKQVKGSVHAIGNSQENLQVARDDLQSLRIENAELKHKVEILESRSEELYAQVNAMV